MAFHAYNNAVETITTQRLLDLNRQFYQTFALQFSATRMRLQPGVRRVVETLPGDADILDLGCGNGELARELSRRNHMGVYIGLDLSPEMLKEAERAPLEPLRATFVQADLASPEWAQHIRWLQTPASKIELDDILAFAVLHHLPSDNLRLQMLQAVRDCLAPGGSFIHSEWQFLNSPRWRGRIQPWERIGLSEDDVDPGDYLLDWRSGGYGLRYVHHFSEDELAHLALETGFEVRDTFYSDGEGGKLGRLGLYQVWKAV
jgi:tRNA (uracil-5-)-methyltransferase TRM9